MKQVINNTKKAGSYLMQRAKSLFLLAICLAFVSISFADTPTDDDGSGIGDPDETTVPFDGGVSLLVAAGIGYGAKKAYDAKKKGTAIHSKKG